MTETLSKQKNTPPTERLSWIRDQLDHGHYLTAWDEVRSFSPLKTWTECEARTLSGRLAGSLGDSRLRYILHLVNERNHPASDEAFYRAAYCRVGRSGPLAVVKRIEARLAQGKEMEPEMRADIIGLKAVSLARLRDFHPAYAAIDEAIAICPASSWLHVQKSIVLELDDQYDESLELARQAMEISAALPSIAVQLSDCLIHCGRDDEAIEILTTAHEKGESANHAAELVGIFSERENHKKALHYLREYEKRSPLLSESGKKWLVRRRADFYYLAGDYEACLKQCDKASKESYHARIAKNMRMPGALERKRVRLDVPFTRQYEMSCAPATLASLAAYWKRDIDHLEIADAICYDGTPWHKERTWAESQGFYTREFRLDRKTLLALIDRGIPFTLTTHAVESSHLQACVGYDDRQGVVILRDPTERHYGEMVLESLLENHPVQGPRCMLLIPEEERGKLDEITLPDTEIYHANHLFSIALDEHDREAAIAAVAAMPADHPMTQWMQYRLAAYDCNPMAEFQAIDNLANRFPENDTLRYARLKSLHSYHDPSRQGELLQAEMQRDSVDPVFYSEMGEFLLRDARQLSDANYYLRKAVRQRYHTGRVYSSLAWCRSKQRRFVEVMELRRVASCLESSWEPYASAYAESCRAVSQPERGLEFLQQRVERLGEKSGGPWKTLAEELDSQDQGKAAIEVLEKGAAARADDGELMLAGGRLLITWGEQERGKALMSKARHKVRDAEWLLESARIAGFLGERKTAIEFWQELLLLQPYSIEVYRALTRLIAEEEGTPAAMKFIREATDNYPKLPTLWMLCAEWESSQNPAREIECLERALALDADSQWCLRELALRRLQASDKDGALTAAREALAKDPNAPASHGMLGRVFELTSRRDEAKAAFEKAIQLDVDYTYASKGLVRLARDRKATLAALSFIEKEMLGQVSDGTIVSTYRTLAYPHIDPEELLSQLRDFCKERPDLWETWAGRLQQALDMGRAKEALECGTSLTERFPVLPRAWIELASVHRAAQAYEEDVEALRSAVNLSPAWDWAARELSLGLERLEQFDEALEVLTRALYHEPLEGPNHGFLADLKWKLGNKEEAFDTLLFGLSRCPSYDWGWSKLCTWARELGYKEKVVTALDAHRETRSHIAGWWDSVAEYLDELGFSDRALAAVDEGLKQHAEHLDLYDRQAYLLASQNRFEEALDACEEGLKRDQDNRYLLGRRAWVLMEYGQPNEAINQMSTLVDAQQDYVWAIRVLAGWLSTRDRWQELRDLAEKWIRQSPQSGMAHGYLGQAAIALDDRETAKQALFKAFSFDPEYEYAGRNLLTYQIEDGDLDDAEKTLRILEHNVNTSQTVADAIELAVARENKEGALLRAKGLFEREDANADLLTWVGKVFEKKKWRKDWLKLLDAQIANSETLLPATLACWIRTLKDRKLLKKGVKRLNQIREKNEELAEHGWVVLLNIPEGSDESKLVNDWISKNGGWFRTRGKLWRAAGNALTEVRNYHGGMEWMKDWPSRTDDLTPALLFNYGVAAEYVEGWRSASKARAKALEMDPSGSLSASLRATVALQCVLSGKSQQARVLLEEVEQEKLSEYYDGYLDLCRSVLAAENGQFEDSQQAYQKALGAFNQWQLDKGAMTYFDSAREELARHLPWAKSKPKKIARRWGKYTGYRNGWSDVPWWLVGLLVYFFIRVLLALMK